MIIKKANVNDINNGLLDVFIEGYRFHQNGRPDVFLNLTNEDLKNELIEGFSKFCYLLLIENDNIKGYLAYEIRKNKIKKIHVDQLIITESLRGKGYGKKLIDEVIKIARENNCVRVELDCWTFNENAIAMYQHIGFKKQRILFEYDLK